MKKILLQTGILLTVLFQAAIFTQSHPTSIDEDGMLWIAHWNGWQVSRWNPQTGEKLLKIPLPVANVTSCTFGGEGLNDLYITTARKDIPEAELLKQPLAGALFVWKNSGYKGMPMVKFKN